MIYCHTIHLYDYTSESIYSKNIKQMTNRRYTLIYDDSLFFLILFFWYHMVQIKPYKSASTPLGFPLKISTPLESIYIYPGKVAITFKKKRTTTTKKPKILAGQAEGTSSRLKMSPRWCRASDSRTSST